jgi:hypothetical protein
MSPKSTERIGKSRDSETLGEHIVKNYMFHIFDKLGISNRVELVLYAVNRPNGRTTTSLQQEKPPADAIRRGA